MTLHKKLFEIKKKIGKISKDTENPFYKSKYFDINALLEHVEPLLQEHNLLCLQPIEDGKVKTVIYNVEEADFVSSEIKLPELTDPQKLGSSVTYYRRYTLQSLLGLQAEDDDGNKASKTPNKSSNKAEDKPWLNITDKAGKHTKDAEIVYNEMLAGNYNSVQDVRKDFAVSKVTANTLESWLKQVKQQA